MVDVPNQESTEETRTTIESQTLPNVEAKKAPPKAAQTALNNHGESEKRPLNHKMAGGKKERHSRPQAAAQPNLSIKPPPSTTNTLRSLSLTVPRPPRMRITNREEQIRGGAPTSTSP